MKSQKSLLISAVCLTIAALSGWVMVVLRGNNVFQILSALLFTLSAGLGWKQYIKKKQEE